MSKWSHLANTKHIDRIIAQVKANPKTWNAVMGWRGAAYVAAYDAAWNAVSDGAWNAAWYAVPAVACGAAWDAILALVVWDYSGGLMDLPAEQVKVLAILGDQAAILMYPAIVAMETTQELA